MSRITIHPLASGAVPARAPADEALIQRLQDSFRDLSSHGMELADRFYAGLFAAHPELRPLFPTNMVAQKKKLLDTLALVIENLRAPQVVTARIDALGAAHVKYGAKPQHYPMVAGALVSAMAETGGPNWSPDLSADWSTAIRQITVIMLNAAAKVPPT